MGEKKFEDSTQRKFPYSDIRRAPGSLLDKFHEFEDDETGKEGFDEDESLEESGIISESEALSDFLQVMIKRKLILRLICARVLLHQ